MYCSRPWNFLSLDLASLVEDKLRFATRPPLVMPRRVADIVDRRRATQPSVRITLGAAFWSLVFDLCCDRVAMILHTN
jgi:hypothetical protein